MLKLSKQQKKAAEFVIGTASVVSVPGAGKTLTMTHRIGNLVMKHAIPPETILGLTFTRNAAQSMKDKLRPILNELTPRVNLSTIHSFCHHLLRNEGRTFEILSEKEQIRFLKDVMKKAGVRNLPAGLILSEIRLAKNNLIPADEFRNIHAGDPMMSKVADVFCAYESEKKKKLLMDFNDLLTETYDLMRNNSEVREKYSQTYTHILVDELQDVSPAQMAILKLLTGNKNDNYRSFWICGDDWQSIYSFTGATIGNILNFKELFPKSEQFVLETNYRSTPQILKVCQNLMSHNSRKIEKNLKTDNPDGDEVIVIEGTDEEDEASKIVYEIRYLTEQKGYALNDIAILYRANCQSRAVEEIFSQNRIPYHIENGMNFYQRYEVKILLDYMRLIINPYSDEGDEALANIINIPNRYIGKKFMNELEEFAKSGELGLYEALKSMHINIPYLRKYVKDFINLIEPLTGESGKIEPSELIHILREGLDYDKYITEDDVPSPDDSKIANINQLQLSANKYRDIRSFLNFTETFREEISNDKNGVSLMTVHKSKGLEFQIVFVIGFTEGILPNKNGDIEEERRIAFVALSRAMKLLYVSYSESHMGRQAKKSLFLNEMFP